MLTPLKKVVASRNPDYWWEVRHQSKLQELKQIETGPDILLIGDSITHVWEEAMGSDIHAKKIWNDFFSDYQTYNVGYCGDGTENVLWRLQNGEIDGISRKWRSYSLGPITPACGKTLRWKPQWAFILLLTNCTCAYRRPEFC